MAGLPPAARPPGRKLSPESAQDVARVRRVQGTVAAHYGPQDGLTESERPFKPQEPTITSDRFMKPSCGKSVRVWRNKKTGRFAEKPYYVK